ncbi:MAG TPA: hypothetical protein VFV08_06320 [Puia sp.]|nr:hypothetical protein [Puia sp.]
MKTRKFILLAFVNLLILTPFISEAQYKGEANQTTPVRPGSVILNLGLGAGAEYNGYYYNQPFGTKMAIEWGLWQAGPGTITLGPEIGGSFSSGGYYDNYRARTLVIAGRSAWHYGWDVRGLDTYGGLSLGVGFVHQEYYSDGNYVNNKTIVVPGAFVGASYFLSRNFGLNAEAGFDITNFQVGLVFKLQ